MKLQGFIILAIGLALGSDFPKVEPPPTDVPKVEMPRTDMEKLQGVWKMASFERDGTPIKEAKKYRLAVTGDQYLISFAGRPVSAGTVKLDASKSPKELEYIFSNAKGTGRDWVGIYMLDGDTYKVCACEKSRGRPKEFATLAGTGREMCIWKREKP